MQLVKKILAYQNKIKLIALTCTLLLYAPQYIISQNTIKKGIINLSNHNFNNAEVLDLNGEWAFYFEKEYKDIQSNTSADYIQVPFEWNHFGYKGTAFAVYKLNIVMPKDYNDLMLRISHQSTAYNLYLNNKLVYSVGKFGTNSKTSHPYYENVNQTIPNNSDTLTIAIEISNFHYKKGGLWGNIKIAKRKAIEAKSRDQLAFDVFLIGALLVLLIYHLILFFQLKTNKMEQYKIPLFFSALTFISILRTASTSQLFLTILFPNLAWSWLVKFEFISFFMMMGIGMKYIKSVLPNEFSNLIVNITFATCSIVSITTLFLPIYYSSFLITPMEIVSISAILYFIYGVLLAVKRKREMASFVLFAILIIAISIINDILFTQSIIRTLYLAPFGILFFFITQAVLLSKLLSGSFKKEQTLSLILTKLNEGLEQKVEKRTIEIQKINKELQLLSVVADKTDNAVLIVDSKGQIEWINKGFSKLYGYTLEEFKVKGVGIFDTVSNDDVINPIKDLMINKKTSSYDTQLLTNEGEEIWVNTTWTPILDENDNIVKMIAIDADISKQKEVEESLKLKNIEITKQHKHITNSIVYAQRIQKALLSPLRLIDDAIDELKQRTEFNAKYFILYKPKDIVSGDFYWAKYFSNNLYLAAVDCTGHGVPGAFMSALGISFLNEIVNMHDELEPNIILNKLREKIIVTLRQKDYKTGSRDGMDISLCRINYETMTLEYAGAYQPLYLVRNENGEAKLIKIKGNNMPIGIYINVDSFTMTSIKIKNNDSFYFGSDGYVSQFGGEKNKTFKAQQLEKLLLEINHLPMAEQNKYLDRTLSEWQQDNVQIDDILIFGIKLTQNY